jgi:excisionase family DNA binding protein
VVIRAFDTAQRVARGDGIAPNGEWLWLRGQLAAEAASAPLPTAAHNAAALPRIAESASSSADLIDTREAARLLGCRPRNVRDLCHRGALESSTKHGGHWRVDRLEVEALVCRRAEARNAKENA